MATNVLRVKRPNEYMSSTNGLISTLKAKQKQNPQQPTGMASSFAPAAGRMVAGGLRSAAAATPFTSGAATLTSGARAVQSIYKPKQAQAAPITSVAPKQIPGSGYGQNYASNAGNYTPRVAVPKPTPTTPTSNPGATYLTDAQATAEKQKAFAKQQEEQKAQYIKDRYGLANQALEASIPQAQGEFNDLKASQEGTIADLLAGAERQKAQTRDYYGEAQRGAMQTRRETQGQTQRTFANLGTLDSRGEGSFAQANENTDSEFNRFTQQNLMAQANKLTEIDAAIGTAERQARAAIATEERKLKGLVDQIRLAQSQNKLDEAAALTDAYNETQSNIYEIEDTMNQLKYTFAQEQQKLETEMAKFQSFSPEFMAGGPPTNQAEYEFFIKNQKDIQSVMPGAANSGKQEVVSAIQDLMASPGGLGQVTGWGNLNPMNRIPEADANATRAKLERVKALVSLDNADKLKGTGAISDAERALLAAASTAINSNLSPQQLEAELNRIVTSFGGSQQQSGGMIRVQSPDGQVGTIDQSELSEAMANGWRRI